METRKKMICSGTKSIYRPRASNRTSASVHEFVHSQTVQSSLSPSQRRRGKASNCSLIKRLDVFFDSKCLDRSPLGVQKFAHGNKICAMPPEPC